MSKFADVAVNVFDVIREIVKSYLMDDPEKVLYRTQELAELLDNLSSEKVKSLKLHFSDAFMRYSTPLPLRPHYAELYHARTLLILELRKLPLQFNPDCPQETVDAVFLDTLSDVLQKKSFNLSTMTSNQIDCLFDNLKIEFRAHFIHRINKMLIDTGKSASVDRDDSPEICAIFYDEVEGCRDSSCATSTPFAFSKSDGRTSSAHTTRLFSPVKLAPSKTNITVVYDSDLEEDIEETIVDFNNLSVG